MIADVARQLHAYLRHKQSDQPSQVVYPNTKSKITKVYL